MPRPLGVTILAICYVLFTLFAATLGLASILGAGFIAQIIAQNEDLGALGSAAATTVGIVFAIFFLGLAVLFGFIAYGMWNLRNWARITAIVLSTIGAIFAGLALLASVVMLRPFRLLTSGIRLGINLLILWYLNQPHVKQAFVAASLPPAGGFAAPPPAQS
jgi:hypothetical protein